MSKLRLLSILLALHIALAFSSCLYFGGSDDNTPPPNQTRYKPVTLDRDSFENSIRFAEPANMQNAGKIYVYKNWIFISDTNKGFFIYDNTNPSVPMLKSFLEVPGATDMAIRNNVIYINQAVDLITIHIEPDEKKVKILKRIPNIFPEKLSPNGQYYSSGAQTVVVDWIKI